MSRRSAARPAVVAEDRSVQFRPAVAEDAPVQADAAIDVGDTLVGMHIRPVAVPLRMENAKVGQAHVVMAYCRYPLIGGARAQYPEAIR